MLHLGEEYPWGGAEGETVAGETGGGWEQFSHLGRNIHGLLGAEGGTMVGRLVVDSEGLGTVLIFRERIYMGVVLRGRLFGAVSI